MDRIEFTTSSQPLDLARIEAEAHRLRAEALRDGIAWLGARIAALWSRPRAAQPRAV
jgi:hypothetical protein